ncbi:zinc finger and SCAN domain-containing protein 29-like [Engraulis encrasicolus]|uniref:zinc finger and SCAN domain-containing protein 29-like n=1 Tax=Engraulis encrasicolus TaxID=184585 RepID=UPI002FD5E5A1
MADAHKKNVQWSAEETKALLAIWTSVEFQAKLETSTRKTKLYGELVDELRKLGFSRTSDQIVNKLKKLKKDYRDTKRDLSKSGNSRPELDESYEMLDAVMGCRPANSVEGSLNSATAAAIEAHIEATSRPATPRSDIGSLGTDTNISDSEQDVLPPRQTFQGKRKRQNSVDDILHYMEKTDARAEEREAERNRREEERDERMLQDMQQSNTALMGLMERLVSSIETANRGVQGQGQGQ